MANANPSNRRARATVAEKKDVADLTLTETGDQPATQVENGAAREAPKLSREKQEKLDAPYGRHTDGRPFDKGPKLDAKTQSYFPAIWQEEVESVDNHGNRRMHTIVLEDR